MKKWILFTSFILSGMPAMAQPEGTPCMNCYDPEDILKPLNKEPCCLPLQDSIVEGRLQVRRRNLHFFSSLQNVQPPSALAGGGLTSYTFNTLGFDKKNFILDADVQFPIAVGGKRFGLNTLHIIPRFMIRIFQEDPTVPFGPEGDISLPVRTPGTIPGIAYYFSFKNWWNPDRQWAPRKLKKELQDPALGANQYVGVYAFHHSNGQDGNEIYPNNYVNTYNGNYGEQVVFEFIYGRQLNFIPKGEEEDLTGLNGKRKRDRIENNGTGKEVFVREKAGKQFNWRLSFEWHPYGASNQVFRELAKIGNYPSGAHMLGRNILKGRASLHFLPSLVEYISNGKQWCAVTPGGEYERWRLMTSFGYVLDTKYYRGPNLDDMHKISLLGAYRRLNMSATAFHILKRSRHVAAFAELGYYGSDPYNIYFNDSLWQFKFGLAFGFFQQPDQPDITSNQ